MVQHMISWKVPGAITLANFFIQLLLLTQQTSSFTWPTSVVGSGASRVVAQRACSCPWSRRTASESDSVEPVVDVAEDETENGARTPAGLTLEGVYKRFYMEVQGLDDGIVGLESRDTSYGVSAVLYSKSSVDDTDHFAADSSVLDRQLDIRSCVGEHALLEINRGRCREP